MLVFKFIFKQISLSSKPLIIENKFNQLKVYSNPFLKLKTAVYEIRLSER